MADRVLTDRELNRALLARQLLLARARLPVARAVERLCALQAQYSPSPYLALWSRLDAFRKQQLTRALERRQVVKASLMRITLQMVSAADYPYFAAAWLPAVIETTPRTNTKAVEEASKLVREAARTPITHDELHALGSPALGGFRWRTRALAPLVHIPPSGTWSHFGRPSLLLMDEWLGGELPSRVDGAERLVSRYLRAFGPATQNDLLRFAGLRVGDVRPGLERLSLRTFTDERGKTLLDLPRQPLPGADTPAPVRFLPKWEQSLLAYDTRTRILPAELQSTVIRKNGDVHPTFLVDGVVAGIWAVERKRDSATLTLAPFAPLPARTRRELEAEGYRLVRWIEDDATSYAVRFTRDPPTITSRPPG